MGAGSAFPADVEERLEAEMYSQIEDRVKRRMEIVLPERSEGAIGLEAKVLRQEMTLDDALGALKDRRRDLLAEKIGPKHVGLMPPKGGGELQPTNVLWGYMPPYELDNRNHWQYGSPNQWVQQADKNTGTTTLAQHVVDHTGGGWGWAGVGFWYVPHTTNADRLELRTSVRRAYEYHLDSSVETAHSRAEVGVNVFSWDGNGGDFREEPAVTDGLWAYGTSGFGSHGDADYSFGYSNPLRLSVNLVPSRRYSCFAYAFASTDASGTDGLFSGSCATTDVWTQHPWMFTQEWGWK